MEFKLESKSKFKTELIYGKVLIKISLGKYLMEFTGKMGVVNVETPIKKILNADLAVLF